MGETSSHELHERAIAFKARVRFPVLHDPRYPVHRVANRLEPYLAAIVEKIKPERIILFGSYAHGHPTEHSDFDLLVVHREIRSEKKAKREIRDALDSVPGVPPPFTILAKTPESLAERLSRKSPFYEDILRQGLVVYAPEAL